MANQLIHPGIQQMGLLVVAAGEAPAVSAFGALESLQQFCRLCRRDHIDRKENAVAAVALTSAADSLLLMRLASRSFR